MKGHKKIQKCYTTHVCFREKKHMDFFSLFFHRCSQCSATGVGPARTRIAPGEPPPRRRSPSPFPARSRMHPGQGSPETAEEQHRACHQTPKAINGRNACMSSCTAWSWWCGPEVRCLGWPPRDPAPGTSSCAIYDLSFHRKKNISCDMWICDLVICDCPEVEEGRR